MRIHPYDKNKTPYTWDGFLRWQSWNQTAALKMWKESSAVNPMVGWDNLQDGIMARVKSLW